MGLHVAKLLALLTIENIGFGNCLVAAAGEHGLYAVLNIFNTYGFVFDFALKSAVTLRGESHNTVVIGCACGLKGLFMASPILAILFDEFAVSFSLCTSIYPPLFIFHAVKQIYIFFCYIKKLPHFGLVEFLSPPR